MYHRHCIYAPEIGRFCSRDPIGYADGMNFVEYVKGAPTGYADSTGLNRDNFAGHIMAKDEIYKRLLGICTDCHCTGSDHGCFFDECQAEADRIAWAIFHTLEGNYLWSIRDELPDWATGLDERYKGYWCYEWAYGLEDTVNLAKGDNCFNVHVDAAGTAGDEVHYWIEIGSHVHLGSFSSMTASIMMETYSVTTNVPAEADTNGSQVRCL